MSSIDNIFCMINTLHGWEVFHENYRYYICFTENAQAAQNTYSYSHSSTASSGCCCIGITLYKLGFRPVSGRIPEKFVRTYAFSTVYISQPVI